MADDLLRGHRRLGSLVNDLLILAAVDGRAPHRAEPVDLAGVVTDCPAGLSLMGSASGWGIWTGCSFSAMRRSSAGW